MQRMMTHMENQYTALKKNLGIEALLADSSASEEDQYICK